jgi:hypothetical protein
MGLSGLEPDRRQRATVTTGHRAPELREKETSVLGQLRLGTRTGLLGDRRRLHLKNDSTSERLVKGNDC